MFSGTSRFNSERIFGRTTLVSQFMRPDVVPKTGQI
jgi:hypothetical protein